MDTIIYQGREIAAEQVGGMSGHLCIALRDEDDFCHQGNEVLFRSTAGEYYLSRRLQRLDLNGENERRASGRETVHRLSLAAAVQWAVMRVAEKTYGLRHDAAALLRLHREHADVFTGLDDLARAMLLRACREGTTSRKPGEDPRDLVNAAVTYYLCDERNEQHGEFDLNDGYDALARAKADRLRTCPPAPEPTPAPPVEVAATEESPRFAFDVPPTASMFGLRWEGGYDPKQMPEVERLATVFGLEVDEFTRQLLTRALPGQTWEAWKEGNLLVDQMGGQQITAFGCATAALFRRVARAARANGQTVSEYVAYVVASHVDMDEEAMLVHPVSGEPLHANRHDLTDGFQSKPTTPPTGAHGEITARVCQTIGRKHVQFSVWLDPEQVERIALRNTTAASATPDETFVHLPITGGVHPRLTIDGREVDLGLPLPLSRPVAADRPDAALCAAGAVEPLDENVDGGDEEDDDTLPDLDDRTPWGQTAPVPADQPLVPALRSLAGQWQAQAQEARCQQAGLAPVLTSGKPAAQADLLEGCAGALLAALDGKEGR